MNANLTNAAPSTNLAALINTAIDLGLTVVEAPIGAGILIVEGAAQAVREWLNDAPGMVTDSGAGRATAARVVLG